MDYCTFILAVVGVIGLWIMFRQYMSGGVYRGLETMAGKTVVITGGNDGIGKETVRELAKRGARVIMGNRDTEKGERVLQEISSQTNSKQIENRKLDLASFTSIRAFAKSVLETESKIDVLINNAGVVMGSDRRLTADGLEMTIGINHFGHFLLTNLLLDRLKKSAPSRIVAVSALGYKKGRIDFDDINSEKDYGITKPYVQSKLANILHSLELSKRLEGTGVTTNTLHPGVVYTNVHRHIDLGRVQFLKEFLTAALCFSVGKNANQGAQTTLRLAIDPTLDKVTGKYFSDCHEQAVDAVGRDIDVAKRLWQLSEDITKKQD